MRKSLATLVISASVLGGAAAAVALPAGAQDPGTSQEQGAQEGRHPGIRRLVRGVVTTAADTIGIERSELVSALRDGQSIAQVAEANGVDPQAVVDALVAKGNAKIDEALAEGRIDEDRAATAKEKLPERVAKLVERVPGSRAGG